MAFVPPRLTICLLIAATGALSAQFERPPVVRPEFEAAAVIPSGGDRPTSLSPGLLFSIYGRNLGPSPACSGQADPTRRETPNPARPRQGHMETLIYPKRLCGVEVFLGEVPAGLLYVHERQINFKVPQETPIEGTAELRAVVDGISSNPATVELGLQYATLTLEEPAYAGMPVWVSVSLPLGWGGPVRYPLRLEPGDFGCIELEVRRGGSPLPRLKPRGWTSDSGAVRTGPWCGSSLLSGESHRPGQLPLHLVYGFENPGVYEVRYTRQTLPPRMDGGEVIGQSKWTPFRIRAPEKNQRERWLADMAAAKPQDAAELLTDFLPSVLGVADASSHAIVRSYLHHPDRLVQRYTLRGLLTFWPETTVSELTGVLLRGGGPKDLMNEFSLARWDLTPERADGLIEQALPYLLQESTIVGEGAVVILRRAALGDDAPASPAMRTRAETALIVATRQSLKTGSPWSKTLLAASLGQMRNPRARELLWEFVEQGFNRQQATEAIARWGDPKDLPKLARLFEATDSDEALPPLAHILHREYGEQAIPYLEKALAESGQVWVRRSCAHTLIRAGRPAGFAFAADSIEHDWQYKTEILLLLRGQFPEYKGADEAAILASLRQRVASDSDAP